MYPSFPSCTGISVVKAIVDEHHGAVGLYDRPGGGSVFWFTLPLSGPEAKLSPAGEEEGGA